MDQVTVASCEDLHLRGLSALAERSCKKILCRTPSSADALHLLGVFFAQRNHLASAILVMSRAIAVSPQKTIFFSNRAKLFHTLRSLDHASLDLRRGLSLDPGDSELLCGHGLGALEAADFESAWRMTSRCLVVSIEHARGYCHLGVILDRSGNPAGAIENTDRALVLDPSFAEAWYNRAGASLSLANTDNAVVGYLRAMSLGAPGQTAALNAACLHLLNGNFSEGWELYERRWLDDQVVRSQQLIPGLRENRPPFSPNASSRSKRVLVWAEQGVGDEVMFGGLLGGFRGLCGEMLLQVDRRLMGLFSRALPGVRVFERGVPVPEELYDEQIPMGSLGKWLRPTRESFAGKGGRYLQAQEGLGAKLRGELGVKAGERLIGLSWRSESPVEGVWRSLSLSPLVAALFGSSVRFVNLQYGDVRDEIAEVERQLGVQVLSHPGVDNREDLEGLAGLIEGCDLVVSVGNATAHLSGALGQKTWVLLPYVARWPWLREGSTCPWYQSVTSFRQREENRWEPVLDAIRRRVSEPSQ